MNLDLLSLLHDLARHSRMEADRRASSQGLTLAQWKIIIHLERQAGLSQKELAEILEVEPITIARLIDRLEAHGLVQRRDDPSDRRIWRLHLTRGAAPVLKALAQERAAMLEAITKGLSRTEIATVEAAMVRMKENVVAGLRARETEVA
ncbi:MAG: MarR family transcriptional regulator [Rhodospirillales bacterium]|nr:MarR family transcriptional regulator [Rhodospirillales bacterium]